MGSSRASNVDKLIDKLVEKNILTRSEATELIQQINEEEKKEKKEVAGTGETKDVRVPDWLGNMKVQGNSRVRFQTEDIENDKNNSYRNRERIRLRLGVETAVNDSWKAGFGFVTSSGDPRSTHQTLGDTFSLKDISVNYAYAQYTPVKWAELLMGKFKNPIWNASNLIWDGNIYPEGAAVRFKYKAAKNVELFANLDAFVLQEFSDKANDPYLIAIQPGLNLKLPGDMYFKIAGSYYDFNYVKGNDWTKDSSGNIGAGWGVGTNSRDAAGNWMYDYDSFAGNAEFGLPEISGYIPYAVLYGQYVRAIDSHDNNTGWLAGFKFGHKDANDFGRWHLSYNYRRLEKDAWPDFLSDFDSYNGNTNIKGEKIEFLFGLNKNVSLGLNYFKFDHILRTSDDTQHKMQADINMKF
uniref:Uncharacterized protein n=1 Tax=uncultured Desulfobacterium sp. TaxID=201089 RepID=E1Y8R7_9BACT|nr:hypothetical protein N47_A09900 [uncultured Desulfobacterium sp.]